MKKLILFVLVSLVGASPVAAEIRIAATTPNMGMLAEAIGGDEVDVTVMAPADRDPHYLEARPSMMAALRRADLVVAVGAELEVGWLPAAIDGAANPAVRPGNIGYFEGARHVELLGGGGPADRSRGDVHPEGNPHYYLDPVRLTEVGHALAERLERLSDDDGAGFRESAEAFEQAVTASLPDWREAVQDAPGVLQYHDDATYLLERLDVTLFGFLEPLPGIPPTASHLNELMQRLQNERGVILHRVYQPAQAPVRVGERLGWAVHSLESQVQPGGTVEDYLALIDRYVQAIAHPDG